MIRTEDLIANGYSVYSNETDNADIVYGKRIINEEGLTLYHINICGYLKKTEPKMWDFDVKISTKVRGNYLHFYVMDMIETTTIKEIEEKSNSAWLVLNAEPFEE